MPRTQQTRPTSEEILAKQLSALNDSINLVNSLIATDASDNENLDRIYRNYRHLEIMLAKPEIAGSGTDFTNANAAISNGPAYINLKDPEFLD